MATRNPLIYNSGDLVEMTSAQIDAVVDNIVYQYSQNIVQQFLAFLSIMI